MTVSSRTPEGQPSRCPLCDAKAPIEFSEPAGDATCPNCGCLIWRSEEVLDFVQQSISRMYSIPLEDLQAATLFETNLEDSLGFIEVVMDLEDRYQLVIPDEDYEQIRSIGHLVRYVVERWGGEPAE